MRVVFNELSLQSPLDNKSEAQDIMKEFIQLYKQLDKNGIENSIIVNKNFDLLVLAEGYPIQRWRNDSTIDTELKRVYRTINDKVFYYNENMNELISDNEFICTRGNSQGCVIAYKENYISISFNSEEYWNTGVIEGIINELGDEGEIKQNSVKLNNVSTLEHLDLHRNFIHESNKNKVINVNNGRELWNLREDIFPHLIFCNSTRKNIIKLKGSSDDFKQIKQKLILINEYFKTWQGGYFNMDFMPNISPQSQATLDTYKSEHTFTLPDGREELFSLHCRFTGNGYNGRVYFIADNKSQKCVIGHIGKKLPTVSFPNP